MLPRSSQDRRGVHPKPAPLSVLEAGMDASKNLGAASDSECRENDIRQRYAHGRRGQGLARHVLQEDRAIPQSCCADSVRADARQVCRAHPSVSTLQIQLHLAGSPKNLGYAMVRFYAQSAHGSEVEWWYVDSKTPIHH